MALNSGGEDTEGALRKQLDRESTRKDPNGAAFRWAFCAGPNGHCQLQLHSLPVPESVVSSKPLLRMDDVAVVVIKTWPIQCLVWDGLGGLSGPVPVIFTEQPEELRTTLSDEPDSFFAQLNRFMAR